MIQRIADNERPAHDISRAYYVIDPAQAERQQRDMSALLLSRRCPDCVERVLNDKKPPTVRKQIRDMSRCCAQAGDFIQPTMPLKEIVFRLLLKNSNKATSLQSLHWDVTEEWAAPTHPMNITVEVMKQILDSDNFYCFKESTSRARERSRKKAGRNSE
jgi:hypothetical protein